MYLKRCRSNRLWCIGKYWLDTTGKRAEGILKEKVEKYDNL